MVYYKTRSGWGSILYSTDNWEGNNEDNIMIWRGPDMPALYNGKIEKTLNFPRNGYMMSADMNGDTVSEVIVFTDTRAYIYGSKNIDITAKIDSIEAPRPQLKKHYLFTRYWGGEYDKEEDTTLIIDIDTITNIYNISLANSFNVYPNPVNDILTVYLPELPDEKTYISIYNNTGKLIIRQSIGNSTETINLNYIPAGLYILKLTNEKQIITKRFLKK